VKNLQIDIDARGVATLALSRAEKHNAMSAEMISELTVAAQQLGEDENVRVVVLAGAGKTFCAGGDLRWMQDMADASPKERHSSAVHLARMLRALNELPKPLIGKCHANAFGGGVGLLSVTDVAICVDSSVFGLTETRLGLVPATIGPYVVARMGEARARQVFMSSRRFDANEAQSLGLISKVVSAEELDDAVEAEITPYLLCAPKAVANAKALARRLGPVIDEAVIDMSAQTLVKQWESDETAEGLAAFFEGRKPGWAKA
jgi:methylglutaconyl-CoA hydratase